MKKTRLTAKQIQQFRDKHRLTQSELAQLVGVERNTVNRWEMGMYPVPYWVGVLLLGILTPESIRKGSSHVSVRR